MPSEMQSTKSFHNETIMGKTGNDIKKQLKTMATQLAAL